MVPGRLVVSAKSWLSHSGVDRTAPLLPWHGAPDVEKLSPVEVSGRYLAHIREAWDAKFPSEPLAQQDIVLTLPASFDEIARELTVKAAARAGLARVVLIEEPQAAFYAWIYKHANDWERLVSAGPENPGLRHRRRHVGFHADPGPGRRRGQGAVPPRGGRRAPDPWRRQPRPGPGPPHRTAVDRRRQTRAAAMVRAGAELPAGQGNAPGQRRARAVDGQRGRRRLAADRRRVAAGSHPRGSPQRALGRVLSLRRPGRTAGQPPLAASRSSGCLRSRPGGDPLPGGLSHGAPPRGNGRADAGGHHDPARPDIVLFNGGLFESRAIQERLLEVLTGWFRKDGPATGARWCWTTIGSTWPSPAARPITAWFAAAKACGSPPGWPERITSAWRASRRRPFAWCPPGSSRARTWISPQRPFDLLVSEPVEFPLFVSSTRLVDRPGELVPIDREQMTPLPADPHGRSRRRKRASRAAISVNLHARLTEIGTLDLWCSESRGPAELAAAVRRPLGHADRRRRPARRRPRAKASSMKRSGRSAAR